MGRGECVQPQFCRLTNLGCTLITVADNNTALKVNDICWGMTFYSEKLVTNTFSFSYFFPSLAVNICTCVVFIICTSAIVSISNHFSVRTILSK